MSSVNLPAATTRRTWRREPFVPIGMFVPLALLLVCNLADVVTTHRVLGLGGREMNPVAGWLLVNHGLLVAKLGLVALVGTAAAFAPPRRWIQPALWAVTAGYMTIIAFHLTQLALV